MLFFTELNSLNLPLSTFMAVGTYLVIGIYAIFTAIFYYHWTNYAANLKITSITMMLYFGTTIPLLTVIVASSFFM